MQNPQSSGPWRPWRRLRRWYFKTPERALDAAYRAALAIQKLEQEYFQGQMMTADGGYTGLEWGQLKSERDRNLAIIQRRLREFRASRSTLNWLTRSPFGPIPLQATDASKSRYSPDETYQFSENLKKLKVIDEIAAKYLSRRPSAQQPSQPLAAEQSSNPPSVPQKASKSDRNPPLGGSSPSPRLNRGATNPNRSWRDEFNSSRQSREETASDVESISGQASLLPRSILRTLNRIKEELDPNAEEDVVEKFRYSKSKTVISLKFILLLILVPLLTHQVSKNFLIRPIYNEFFQDTVDVFINPDFEEEAYQELRHYEERLRFRIAIGSAPPLIR